MCCTAFRLTTKSTMNKDKNFLKKGGNNNRSTKAITTDNELSVKSPRFERENEVQVSGHSTPLRYRGNCSTAEASPEVDYGCSPILLPCTQDSNEIAWDWQNNSIKGKESSTKNNLAETPKRNKLLHTKRTTNSPLLQKRLKRKLRTDNIEELAAELKALTEGIYSVKDNKEVQFCQEEGNTKNADSNTQLLVLLDTVKDGTLLSVPLNNNKVNVGTTTVATENNRDKETGSYDELFDDSIDDSMVKCSQAIEERLSLDVKKSSDLLSGDESKIMQGYNIQASKNSTGSSNSSSYSKNSPRMNVSNCLRTYSKVSIKGSTSTSNATTIDRHSSNYQLRDNSTEDEVEKMTNQNKLSAEMKSDLFSIPDDSFDDCLATCIETEKLLVKTSDFDDIFLNINMNNLDTINRGNSTVNCNKEMSSVLNCSKTNSKQDSSNKPRNEVQASTGRRRSSTIVPMENRKFFKTKSLSDQNFSKTTYAPKSSYSYNRGPIHASSSVTTTHSATQLSNSHQTSNVNEKETNNRFTKYKSTSNLSYTKEPPKDIQSVTYTREEIERKRMEAKMRLTTKEAKRKLQQSVPSVNDQLEIPLKRPVKR